jgi:hypothetical protein
MEQGLALMLGMHNGGTYLRAIALTISADDSDTYNVYTAAGSPSDPVEVTLTINAGIKVGGGTSTSTNGSIQIPTGFHALSIIKIVNNGYIVGKGGSGGKGGDALAGNGVNGGSGGHAITTARRTIIDNQNGHIYGGGSGGCGGGAGNLVFPGGGGGGGGGAGYPDSSGGAAGTGTPNGSAGATGNMTYPGGGGAPGNGGGAGGGGGGFGGQGDAGQDGAGGSGATNPGAAGNAVKINSGGSIMFLSGNNAAQVKGAVG